MKNTIKKLLTIAALTSTIFAFTGCSDSDYTSVRVEVTGEYTGIDVDGNVYKMNTEWYNTHDYENGEIVSITLNPSGKVVGVNGRCWIQKLR